MIYGNPGKLLGRCGMNKKILVSGGAGFIGSHLIEEILNRGDEPIILKRSHSNLWRISASLERLTLYDIDNISLEEIFKKEGLYSVVNLAVYYRKIHSYADIGEMIETNVKLPAKLLELCKNYDVGSFITAGSFFQYDSNVKFIGPESPILARNFYAATKNALERLLEYYVSVSDVNIIELILFTPYGEMDDPNKVIPYIIRQAIKDEDIALTDGFQKINPVYVKDIVSALVKAAEVSNHLSISNYRLNIANSIPYSIREIATVVEEILKKKLKLEWGQVGTKQVDAQQALSVDTTNTEKVIRWTPKFSIHEGIERTINYHRGLTNGNRESSD